MGPAPGAAETSPLPPAGPARPGPDSPQLGDPRTRLLLVASRHEGVNKAQTSKHPDTVESLRDSLGRQGGRHTLPQAHTLSHRLTHAPTHTQTGAMLPRTSWRLRTAPASGRRLQSKSISCASFSSCWRIGVERHCRMLCTPKRGLSQS